MLVFGQNVTYDKKDSKIPSWIPPAAVLLRSLRFAKLRLHFVTLRMTRLNEVVKKFLNPVERCLGAAVSYATLTCHPERIRIMGCSE